MKGHVNFIGQKVQFCNSLSSCVADSKTDYIYSQNDFFLDIGLILKFI